MLGRCRDEPLLHDLFRNSSGLGNHLNSNALLTEANSHFFLSGQFPLFPIQFYCFTHSCSTALLKSIQF